MRTPEEVDELFFGSLEGQKVYLQELYKDEKVAFLSMLEQGLNILKERDRKEWRFILAGTILHESEKEKLA